MSVTKKQILIYILAMVLSSSIWADSYTVGTPENPNCTKNGEPVIPAEFIDQLSKELAQNSTNDELIAGVSENSDTEVQSIVPSYLL